MKAKPKPNAFRKSRRLLFRRGAMASFIKNKAPKSERKAHGDRW